MSDKAQAEHNTSAVALIADMRAHKGFRRSGPGAYRIYRLLNRGLAPGQKRLDTFLVVFGQARQHELIDIHVARQIVERVRKPIDGQLGHRDR